MWKLNKEAKFSIKSYMLLLLYAGSFAKLVLPKHFRINIEQILTFDAGQPTFGSWRVYSSWK